MKVFAYHEHDSFLHRLNPLTKLAYAVLIIVALTAIVDPITPLVALLLTLLAIAILGRVSLLELLRTLLPFVVLSFGLIWTTMVFYVADPASHPRVVTVIGPIALTDQGIAYGLVIFFRTLGFFAASLLFVLTTDPTDFVQALIQRLRVSYRFGYGAHAAYRFVPLFEGEFATIRAAHRIRGVRDGGGVIARGRQFIGYLVPLLAGGVRKAERVALAMDARGFGAYPDRTYYRRSTFGVRDVAFAIGTMVVYGGLLFTLHRLGWLGELVPPFWG
ncbi:MAG: energy-coupling factor transporter transmembrane component T family protein [Chloroflexota bacterium]